VIALGDYGDGTWNVQVNGVVIVGGTFSLTQHEARCIAESLERALSL
jgi:hypothetical protein